MRDWQGKRYWIIGAGEGVGLALARQISTAGAEVILSAGSAAQLAAAEAQMPGKAQAVVVDVTDAASVVSAAEAAGEVDGVVYLADAHWPMKAQDWNSEQVTAMCDTNFTGCARVVGAVLPAMVARGSGHLVLNGSLSGFRGKPRTNGYGPSKAGVMAMAETLYADLRGSGVTVQLANLGFVRTPQSEENGFSAPFMMEPEEAAQQMFELMQNDRFKASFPAAVSWLCRLSQLLPDWIYYRIVR